MSGGAGHIADMISRNKANESLLKNRGYFKIKEKYLKAASAKLFDLDESTTSYYKAC